MTALPTQPRPTLGLLRIGVALLVISESWASWRPPHHWQQPGILLVGGLLTVASLAMLVGWRGRWAAGVVGVGMLLLHALGVRWGLAGGGLPFDSAHTFELAISCLLLAAGPCSACLSIDARWRGAGSSPLSAREVLLLLRTHASMTVALVGLSHLSGAWWSGERLAHLLTARLHTWVEPGPVLVVLAWSWVAGEALAVVAPWLPATGAWLGRGAAVWVAAALLGLQYAGVYTGTYSAHMAWLLVLAAAPSAAVNCDRTTRPAEAAPGPPPPPRAAGPVP